MHHGAWDGQGAVLDKGGCAMKSAIRALEAAGFIVHGHKGNFYLVTSSGGDEGVVLRQSAHKWHFFWTAFEGSASGGSPETCMRGGLGDVIDTDGSEASYNRMMRNAPEAYLDCAGLYRCSFFAYNG